MKTGIIILYFSPIFVAIVFYMFQIQEYRVLKNLTEDALAASNLASAVIDLHHYGVTNELIIAEPDSAYQIYCEALKANMGLDDNFMREDIGAISGEVEILDFTIYNVQGANVTVYSYGQNPYYMCMENGLGTVKAPNGEIVESTSIYSRISFPVKGIFNINTTAVKDKLVDVVN